MNVSSARSDRTLAGLDLNLLLVLDALVADQSVTAAARRVGLSQPAMSNALKRLRVALDDPLFVRQGRAMVPTTRCRELSEPVRRALAILETAVAPNSTFEPAARARYRIAMSDYASWVLLPSLLRWFERHAPQAVLEVIPAEGFAAPTQKLRSAELDIAVNRFRRVPESLEQQTLFREAFACIARKAHPQIGKRLTLARFTEIPHLLVSARGRVRGAVDYALAERSLRRTVGATVPHFTVVPSVIASTDYIATVAERVAMSSLVGPALRVDAPPLTLSGFDVEMIWDRKQGDTPRHQWLRNAIQGVASEL